MDLLPPTTYASPPRLARGRLNTILEEKEDSSSQGTRSDSEGDHSDTTVIGRPAGWDPKLFVAVPKKPSRLATSVVSASPISNPSLPDSSPCSSAGDGFRRNRSSYADSDIGTIFSEDSVPSLASDPTTFATDSSRNSIVSSKSGRNRYPPLFIPRGSWDSLNNPIKELGLAMSPTPKITLSPAVLSSLVRQLPSEAGTPSLGSHSSLPSESPSMASLSGPGTPDMRQLDPTDGEGWSDPTTTHVHNALEIAIDDDHSILLSPAEAHEPQSAVVPPTPSGLAALLSPREHEWGGMVAQFPGVPGAVRTHSPVMARHTHRAPQRQPSAESSDGIQLPLSALATLNRLTREHSPEGMSPAVGLVEEMKERSEPSVGSRPRSLEGITPLTESSNSKLSDYSFASLGIPSPGGFFSSLQNGARHTWCIQPSRTNSMPSSAAAENFYFNWDKPIANTIETVLNVADDTNMTEGPPTARQAVFDPKTTTAPTGNGSSGEDQDMYGDAPAVATISPSHGFEYEEAYDEELKQSAEAHLDRTSNWLAAQTTYLSALRDNNPVNSPADNIQSPNPFISEQSKPRTASMDSHIQRTVRFLEAAQAATVSEQPPAPVDPSPIRTSPTDSDCTTKEPIFLEAFKHLNHDRKKLDAFLHATSRMQSVRAGRIALPQKHIENVTGKHVLSIPARPKYSGPFNQNPRATGIFERTPEQLKYEACERQQHALQSVSHSTWQVDALRAIYGGRLLACPAACSRLTQKSTTPLTDPTCIGTKRHRVLDLGGHPCASWAWHAAMKWPNVKIYTVVMKEQAVQQRPAYAPKPQGPENHRTVSVPHLWQLPFKSNHFDVISARNLHMLLKSNPVPGVPTIDEWDLVLKECMRVLKPGGCLDFLVIDSSIAKPGPRGEKMSVEFGFELHRRGYEREAARGWLKRLKKEGYVGVKRAWMFWPMGCKVEDDPEESHDGEKGWRDAPRPVSEVSTISKIVKQYMDVEAVQGPVGSTSDISDLTGLVGGRMWEEWVVKVRREGKREDGRLLEGIDEVLEEGKAEGSGWKVLVGWARKPKGKHEGAAEPKVEEMKMKLEIDDGSGSVTPTGTRDGVVSPISPSGDAIGILSPVSDSSDVGHIPLMIQG